MHASPTICTKPKIIICDPERRPGIAADYSSARFVLRGLLACMVTQYISGLAGPCWGGMRGPGQVAGGMEGSGTKCRAYMRCVPVLAYFGRRVLPYGGARGERPKRGAAQDGKTPLDMAGGRNRLEILAILEGQVLRHETVLKALTRTVPAYLQARPRSLSSSPSPAPLSFSTPVQHTCRPALGRAAHPARAQRAAAP